MKWWILVFLLVVSLTGSFFYFRWSSRIQQPLRFSHALHVKAQLKCELCHTDLSSLPDASLCQRCHKDVAFERSVNWTKVYRIAPDIIFDHAKHSDVPCTTCHEQMSSAAAWVHEYRFPMDFCMKCHAERGAANECRSCHRNRR